MHYFQFHTTYSGILSRKFWISPPCGNCFISTLNLKRLSSVQEQLKFKKYSTSSVALRVRNRSCWPEIWFGLFLKSWKILKLLPLTDLRFKVVATVKVQKSNQHNNSGQKTAFSGASSPPNVMNSKILEIIYDLRWNATSTTTYN